MSNESDWVDLPKNKDDGDWVDVEHDSVNPLSSGIRQFAQGGSAGFSDEIAGGIEALGQAAGVNGAGGPMKDIALDDDGPTLDWNTLSRAF